MKRGGTQGGNEGEDDNERNEKMVMTASKDPITEGRSSMQRRADDEEQNTKLSEASHIKAGQQRADDEKDAKRKDSTTTSTRAKQEQQ